MNIKEKIQTNVELFLEAPILILAFVLAIKGLDLLDVNPNYGLTMIVLSATLVFVEKYIEKKDSK